MFEAYQIVSTEVIRFISDRPNVAPSVLAFLGAGVLGKVVLYLWRHHVADNKRKARQEKAKSRTRKVADIVAQVTNPQDIVKKPIHTLREELRSGKVSALEVLHAFQKQALMVNDRLNCITEAIPEAEQWAQALDASPGFKGLLHGIPVSVKENVALKNYDCTAGMEYFIGIDYQVDSIIVQVLKQHGAIPYVRTNIPQSMLSYDCENPIYGTSLNPLDSTRTTGGSSSGEGALIGGGGSIMGIGNDIGGSLRIPADFCGIYALKPTCGRTSKKGQFSPSTGQLVVQATNGPMARDFDSLLLLSQAFFSPPMFELDPVLPNLPFDMKEFNKTSPMRIGFYTYDGMFQCQPANVRAVMEAKAALEAMGHEVIHFDFPSIMGEGFNGGKYYTNITVPDRFARLKKTLSNDRVVASIGMYCRLSSLPAWLLKCLAFVASFKDDLLALILKSCAGHRNLEEYFNNMSEVEDFRVNFLKAWQSKDLDAVICPVFPSPAVPKKIVAESSIAGCYCWLYNTLNYPSGVVPVTTVKQDDLDKTFDPKYYKPRFYHEKLLMKNSKGSTGLSIGVQCVSLPYKEETCLRVMRDLSKALGKA